MTAAGVLVDSNVLLDIPEEDPHWFSWSADRLAECAERSPLVINPIIFAEVSIGFERNRGTRGGPAGGGIRTPSLAKGGRLSRRQVLSRLSPCRGNRSLAAPRFLHRCPRSGGGADPSRPRRQPLPYLFSPAATDRALRRPGRGGVYRLGGVWKLHSALDLRASNVLLNSRSRAAAECRREASGT